MMRNRSAPDASVIPVLRYGDPTTVAEWLRDAFGFAIRLRIANHRIQMMFGNGALVVSDSGPETADTNALFSMMIRVDDVDSLAARAEAAGAVMLMPAADQPFGERQCSVQDPWGRRWTFTQTIADVDPATWGGVLESRARDVEE